MEESFWRRLWTCRQTRILKDGDGTCHTCCQSRANLHLCDLILLSIKREISLHKLVTELIHSHFIQMSCFQNGLIQCKFIKITIETLVTKQTLNISSIHIYTTKFDSRISSVWSSYSIRALISPCFGSLAERSSLLEATKHLK